MVPGSRTRMLSGSATFKPFSTKPCECSHWYLTYPRRALSIPPYVPKTRTGKPLWFRVQKAHKLTYARSRCTSTVRLYHTGTTLVLKTDLQRSTGLIPRPSIPIASLEIGIGMRSFHSRQERGHALVEGMPWFTATQGGSRILNANMTG